MTFDLEKLMVPGVRSLQPYQPGKSIEELERDLEISGIVKLASNENPRAPSAAVGLAIEHMLPELSRYPDGGGFRLKQALAEQLTVEPGQITLGNGSNDVLELIARAFVQPGQGVIVAQHSFAVYSLIAKAISANLRVVPAVLWGHDLEGMAAVVDNETRIIFIANPNNPTGTWVSRDLLVNFMDSIPNHVLVVLDEAYFEYVDEGSYPDGIQLLTHYPRLIVTRTFSKIHGLAGLRVGYSVSSRQIAEVLNRVRQPFNLNVLGYVAALASLKDEEFIEESRTLNREQMNRICEGLDRLGLKWIPSVGNFVTVDLTRSAAPVFQRMLRSGVIVRLIENYGMPNHLRITVGLEEENARALSALETALSDYV
jgi:histidinol-phosphate aminotransferase